MTTRRAFLETSAALFAVDWMRMPRRAGRLPIGFSTLGCPAWTWAQILDFAAQNAYAGVELRGLGATMDLSRAPEFAPERIPDARRDLATRDLHVTCLGASAHMHELDAAKHAAQLDEARRFIDLAHALGAPYVRVFGNELVHDVPRDALLTHIARALRELGAYAAPKGVTVLIESHGDFTDSPTLLEILHQANSPTVALLWDAHHTFVSGKEEPEYTVQQLRPYIRHTHLKDSVPAGPDGKERRYVLTGTGTVPVRRQVEALARIGYRGYYNFEWEKRWHPEIEAPEIAIAQYATVVGGYLRAAGVPEAAGR